MNITEKEKRIEEAENFFNQLYGKIMALHFSYLITFKNGIETYSFAINNETERRNMAIKAIELADDSVDVWHSVNIVNVKPANGKRGDENSSTSTFVPPLIKVIQLSLLLTSMKLNLFSPSLPA